MSVTDGRTDFAITNAALHYIARPKIRMMYRGGWRVCTLGALYGSYPMGLENTVYRTVSYRDSWLKLLCCAGICHCKFPFPPVPELHRIRSHSCGIPAEETRISMFSSTMTVCDFRNERGRTERYKLHTLGQKNLWRQRYTRLQRWYGYIIMIIIVLFAQKMQ